MSAHLLEAIALTMPRKRTRPANLTIRRRLASAAAAAASATLLTTVGAAPAQAYEYRSGGDTGHSNTSGTGKCKQTTWRTLVVSAEPPAVTGVDLLGGAKDYTWVRYKAYLVNAYNGATVEQTGWSGWLQAADNQVATWSGISTLSGDLRGNYVMDYRIEWWNSTRQLGWEAHRVGKYNFYNDYNVGPFGPFSSCYKAG